MRFKSEKLVSFSSYITVPLGTYILFIDAYKKTFTCRTYGEASQKNEND